MPNNSKKILIFSTNYLPHIGGAEIALKSITDRLSDCDFDLITSRLDEKLPANQMIGNINVFRVGNKFSFINFILPKSLFPLAAYQKGKELLAKNKYDLIFVLQASQAGGAVWLLKRAGLIKQPVILNLQEGRNFERNFNFIRSFVFKKILRSADRIVAISEYLKKIAIANGIEEEKISVIPNGVDLKNFTREIDSSELTELSDKLGIKSDEKVLISVSRFVSKNGILDLVSATALLIKHWYKTPYKLILAGGGPQEQKIKELASNLGIIDNVIFAGEISHLDLPKYLRISDVFIRPSHSEGLGNSFLEAMACGIPVVGTQVGGIPDFLKDRETGMFAEVNNSQSIADAVKILLEDKKLHNNIITNAYKLVTENYDWDKIASDYQELLNKTI